MLIQMKINRVMSKDTSGSPINLLRELIHLSVIKEPVYKQSALKDIIIHMIMHIRWTACVQWFTLK